MKRLAQEKQRYEAELASSYLTDVFGGGGGSAGDSVIDLSTPYQRIRWSRGRTARERPGVGGGEGWRDVGRWGIDQGNTQGERASA